MKSSLFKVSWIGIIILLINIGFAGLLLASHLATIVPPDKFWPLAFAGLAYPIFLAANILFFLFWIIKRKAFFLVSLTVILFGYNHISNTFQLSSRVQDPSHKGISLDVLSYNVRVFDLYNYLPGWRPNYANRNNILEFLQQKDFDIICFQEFVHDRSGVFKTLDTIPGLIRARHSHFEYSVSSRNVNFFGLATFSAYPIINKGRIELSTKGGNQCIFSDIKINNDTIRVYNIHMESIGLSREDYIVMEEVLKGTEQEQISEGGKRILRRLRAAFVKRASQARKVSEHIARSPYPVILAGDFNDTPVSYVYKKMRGDLDDAFSSGSGFGQTYIGAFPSFRIDYILHSPEFTSFNFKTGEQKYSDHYPVSTTLVLTQGE